MWCPEQVLLLVGIGYPVLHLLVHSRQIQCMKLHKQPHSLTASHSRWGSPQLAVMEPLLPMNMLVLTAELVCQPPQRVWLKEEA